jgi:hypothetical protein
VTETPNAPIPITASGVSRLLKENGLMTTHRHRRAMPEGIYISGGGRRTTLVSVIVSIDAPAHRERLAQRAQEILETGGYHVECTTAPHPEYGEFFGTTHLAVTRRIPNTRRARPAAEQATITVHAEPGETFNADDVAAAVGAIVPIVTRGDRVTVSECGDQDGKIVAARCLDGGTRVEYDVTY